MRWTIVKGYRLKKNIINMEEAQELTMNNQPKKATKAVPVGEPKYGTGSEPHWKTGSAHYPVLYKALLEEPSRNKRIEMVRTRTREYL